MKPVFKTPEFILGTKGLLINGSILGATQVDISHLAKVPTLSELELMLKCVLLIVTISFTLFQWRKAAKKSKKDNE